MAQHEHQKLGINLSEVGRQTHHTCNSLMVLRHNNELLPECWSVLSTLVLYV